MKVKISKMEAETKTRRLSQKFILKGVRKDLLAMAAPETKKKEERFFKEKTNFLGCTHPQMSKVADRYYKMLKEDGWGYDGFIGLVERLFKTGVYEETTVALGLIERNIKDFRKSDFEIFERWVERYITNWAHCDHISPHIIGELVGRYPELAASVFEWTKSKNRWVRRAAAVTYVIHGRKGRFHEQIFKTAEALISDGDEMVQKGIGWMLKTTSEADEKAVVKFLLKWKSKAPRLVLRYATEKMNKKNRRTVLE